MTTTVDAPTVPDTAHPAPAEPDPAHPSPPRVLVRFLTPPRPPGGPGERSVRQPDAGFAPTPEPTPPSSPVSDPLSPPVLPAPPAPAASRHRPSAGTRSPSITELATVLRMVLEVLDGRRPTAQLADRLSPPVRRYLGAAVGRLDRTVPGRPSVRPARCGPPGLRSVRTCEPADGVCEVSAGWRYRSRHRALAARFEWTGGRWRCTALRLG